MTLRKVSSQLYELSVAGYFNGERFTKSQLAEAMAHWMRGSKSIIMEIALPDGRWFFEVTDFGGGYDYSSFKNNSSKGTPILFQA